MNKDFLKGCVFVLVVLSVFGLVYAGGYHLASEILPGQFASGDFSFDGNLGIGTTPSRLLTVKGLTALEAVNSVNQWLMYTHTDNTYRLNYNGVGNDEFVIDSSGDVGIGTVSPGEKLDVDGNIKLSGNVYYDKGSVASVSGTNNVLDLSTLPAGTSFIVSLEFSRTQDRYAIGVVRHSNSPTLNVLLEGSTTLSLSGDILRATDNGPGTITYYLQRLSTR